MVLHAARGTQEVPAEDAAIEVCCLGNVLPLLRLLHGLKGVGRVGVAQEAQVLGDTAEVGPGRRA